MGVMDIVHGVLDVAGFIPVVGSVADVANAAIYAAEGDGVSAALSLVAAVPGIGDAAALGCIGLKMGIKAYRASKAFGMLSKCKKMNSLFGFLKGKAKVGAKGIRNMLDKVFDFVKRLGKRKCKGGSCFTGDMLVCVEGGFCSIKEIMNENEIYSCNEQTRETGLKKVSKTMQSEAHTIYHIWLDHKEEVKTTAYHPFYVKGKGWVNAINLIKGALLQTKTGEVPITKIEKTRYEEPVKVYNLQVKEWESYFVSRMQVYVHNTELPCGSEPTIITAGKNFKEHFINHRHLLENVLGKKYPRYKTHAEEFLKDVGKVIDEGIVKYVGKGTLKKGQAVVKAYRGNGISVFIKENNEFVTLLKSGEGLDKAFQLIK